MGIIPDLPRCGQPAAERIEIYSPRATLHGSLDATVYACAEHHAAVREAINAAGLTPFTLPAGDLPGRCGGGYDYLAGQPINAPEPPTRPAAIGTMVPVTAAGEEHYQSAGWGDAPGECGVECACGVAFDGFAEAAALFDDHIARAGKSATPPGDRAPEYRVVVRNEPEDSYVDIVRDSAVIVRWTFLDACEVAQQLADEFGTFTGPASMTRSSNEGGEALPR